MCKIYFELLLNILDNSLAVKTDKGSTDKFWMNWMSPDHLTRYLEKTTNTGCFQVPNFVFGADINKADVQFLFYIKISFVPNKTVNCSTQERVYSVIPSRKQ